MSTQLLTLPGVIPGTHVELRLDCAAAELRACLVHPALGHQTAAWLMSPLRDVEIDTTDRPLGTFDLWLGRQCVTLPIEARAQVEAFLATPQQVTA